MQSKKNSQQTALTQRKISDYALISLKGIAMGAADVVPGVSGGTIAFIVGIYQELLDSIKSINLHSLKLLFSLRLHDFWKTINGNFLLSLIIGIGICIFSLARLVTYLLNNHPILVWAFFFGLVLASSLIVVNDIKRWNWKVCICFIIGAISAFYITMASPANTSDQWWFIFICGAIAICAMILPGISGSFILVLMGKYFYIMDAVKSLKISVLLVFAAGMIIGITSFSRFLSYSLKRFHDITISILAGFMLGSLNKVWPWKKAIETYNDSIGTVKVLTERNIFPDQYIWQAILLALLGFFAVFIIERMTRKKS